MPHPFLLFTWNKPLLPQLKDYLDARHPDADVVPTLITPNFRPWKYLQTVYASEKKPRILARVLPFGDALALWHTTVNKTMPADASILDMVWLLHEAASQAPKALDPETGAPVDILSGMDIDAFYPWGQHLAGLVEEMLSGGILPEDIDPCDDEALPQVARILESLGSIGSIYLKLLRDSHLTTAGLKIYEIMASLKESSRLPAFLTPSERRPVYIIAGHGLSRAEEVVYKALWEAGAHICLHTDPALAGPAPNTAHWSTRHHKKWLDSWQPGKEYAGAADNGTADTSADIRFFAGYDLHSQLKALKGNLADDIREAAPEKDSPKEVTGKDRPAKSVAIVLPSSSLLMPVLHHMPAGDRQTSVSIAMGLPVASTAVHQLLLACLTLQTERDEAGRYHWRKLVGCIDTPVLGFLNG
ncbi:MAG: hypothetical protein Q4F72_08315, partial [Desulfovibrionaceae bacterium]|nr:hypothetical protein [Desulfovibrionaceae bacterium]